MSGCCLRLFLDTNIVVDYLNKREPFFAKTRMLMILGYTHEFELWITASQITDLIYILSEGGKSNLMQDVLRQLRQLRQFVNIFSVSDVEVDKTLITTWSDAEDFLLYQCALSCRADAIITPNQKDFVEQLIKIFDCDELFDWISKIYSVDYSLDILA